MKQINFTGTIDKEDKLARKEIAKLIGKFDKLKSRIDLLQIKLRNLEIKK